MALAKKPFIGQMDRLVDITRTVKTQSPATGSQKTEDELVCRLWACLSDSSGGQDLEGKIMHNTGRTYLMRYNSDVASNGKDYVLTDTGTRYRIANVTPLGRKSHMSLKVTVYE